jgi:hypothetical protein
MVLTAEQRQVSRARRVEMRSERTWQETVRSKAMRTQLPAAAPAATFTVEECCALYSLRAHYSQHRDLFEDLELARLRFLRWLHRTGRVAP